MSREKTSLFSVGRAVTMKPLDRCKDSYFVDSKTKTCSVEQDQRIQICPVCRLIENEHIARFQEAFDRRSIFDRFLFMNRKRSKIEGLSKASRKRAIGSFLINLDIRHVWIL